MTDSLCRKRKLAYLLIPRELVDMVLTSDGGPEGLQDLLRGFITVSIATPKKVS